MSNSVYNQGVQPQMYQPVSAQNAAGVQQNTSTSPVQTQPMPQASSQAGYQPVASYPVMTQPNAPRAGVSAVNIQIFNPTAGAPSSSGNMTYPQSSWYGPQGMGLYPYPMPMPYYYPMPSQQPAQTQQPAATPVNQPAAEQPKMKDKDVVPLTDEYIKTIENYLNNSNPDIRMQGVKELLNRFKELETRKDDPALTNLLNKSLQDPDPNVRMIAMTTLSSGYANGNQKTTQLLNQIQQTPNVYGEDAKLASQVLLKMASRPTTIQVEDKGTPEPKNTQQNQQ